MKLIDCRLYIKPINGRSLCEWIRLRSLSRETVTLEFAKGILRKSRLAPLFQIWLRISQPTLSETLESIRITTSRQAA